MEHSYEFEDLPITTVTGHVVARVAGKALIVDGNVEAVSLRHENGDVELLTPVDPLFWQVAVHVQLRWERGEIVEFERPYRDENAEHRLSLAQVL